MSNGGVCDETDDVAFGERVDFVDEDYQKVDVSRLVLGVANGHGFYTAATGAFRRGHVELRVARALRTLHWLLSVVLCENLLRKETCVDRDHCHGSLPDFGHFERARSGHSGRVAGGGGGSIAGPATAWRVWLLSIRIVVFVEIKRIFSRARSVTAEIAFKFVIGTHGGQVWVKVETLSLVTIKLGKVMFVTSLKKEKGKDHRGGLWNQLGICKRWCCRIVPQFEAVLYHPN